jgi:hypothetical protein
VTVGKGVTRATIIWIVAAAVVGAVAGVLWVLRSEIGGAHTGTPVVVGSVVLTLVAAALLYHGIMVAASEQDRGSDRVAQPRRQNPPQAGASSGPRPAPRSEGGPPAHEGPLTFRRGKQL